MIDTVARRQAAQLIRRFLAREITNDEFEDLWPKSKESSIRAIFDEVYGMYSDLSEQYYERSAENDDVLGRCAAFLETDAEYRWATPSFGLQLITWPLNVLTLGRAGRLLWQKHRPGYWPFESSAARESARADGGSSERHA